MKTWMEKTQIMTTITQTRDEKLFARSNVQNDTAQEKTGRTMEKRHHEIQRLKANKNAHMNPEQKRHEEPEFAKQPEKTYIMQIVEKNPEMPEEIEPNRERGKQLAELMLEYPIKIE